MADKIGGKNLGSALGVAGGGNGWTHSADAELGGKQGCKSALARSTGTAQQYDDAAAAVSHI